MKIKLKYDFWFGTKLVKAGEEIDFILDQNSSLPIIHEGTTVYVLSNQIEFIENSKQLKPQEFKQFISVRDLLGQDIKGIELK